MAKLAIKGHATRGNEVIEILEMLGGKNIHNYNGTFNECYVIDHNKICTIYTSVAKIDGFVIITLEDFLEKFPYKVGNKVYYDNKICDVIEMFWNNSLNTISYGVYDGRIKNLAIVEELKPYKEETMEEKRIDIPKGYEFAGVDDNNQQVIFEKIGCQYPKTYEECCEVLFPNSIELGKVLTSGYNCELLKKIGELLICRDAYWKIAGDWRPEFRFGKKKYCIMTKDNKVISATVEETNRTLVFPTAEIRDAFYENFKDLIEHCKEFL